VTDPSGGNQFTASLDVLEDAATKKLPEAASWFAEIAKQIDGAMPAGDDVFGKYLSKPEIATAYDAARQVMADAVSHLVTNLEAAGEALTQVVRAYREADELF
jgi:hypothetical protein